MLYVNKDRGGVTYPNSFCLLTDPLFIALPAPDFVVDSKKVLQLMQEPTSFDSRERTSAMLKGALLAILLVMFFISGIMFDQMVVRGTSLFSRGDGEGLNEALLEEARGVIQNNFVDQEAATTDVLQNGALAGMVEILGDTGHSRFMTPAMVEEQHNYTAGEFEGIGAYVEMRNGFTTVVSPIDNSPAQAAGVQPGFIVLEVDGEDMSGKTLQEVVDRILGPAGTDVTITFFNPETSENVTMTIKRARIELENVTWTMLPGTTVAQIRIAGFSKDVGKDLQAAIAAAEAEGATGIIFDLRNNPGGLLDEAVKVAGQFLPADSVVVLRQDAQGDVKEERVPDDATPTTLPVVVLINEGSASASEIVSGALQDAGRATLVGETTFGTGTVLNEFPLSDGSAILLATEQWLTPDGRVIWRQGVVPDETVELTGQVRLVVPDTARDLSAESLRQTDDLQLLRALELLEG
ncbi:MAG: S41 family peptidase [Anaerolineae bacterium]|nr:MAG: S41 family peptidase [Anaerolineae bacterium]